MMQKKTLSDFIKHVTYKYGSISSLCRHYKVNRTSFDRIVIKRRACSTSVKEKMKRLLLNEGFEFDDLHFFYTIRMCNGPIIKCPMCMVGVGDLRRDYYDELPAKLQAAYKEYSDIQSLSTNR